MSDRILLPSGRVFSANRGIVGISLTDKNEIQIYEGYDSDLWIDFPDDSWTKAEKRQLAEMMVERWKRWGGLP